MKKFIGCTATSSVVIKHYSNPLVKNTIYEFCKNRWIALEGSRGSERVFIRYRGGKPLTFESPASVLDYIVKYRELNVRTVYASINIYGVLSSQEVLEDPTNVVGVTPFWDIDVEGLDNWRWAIEVARIIVDFLEKMGVKNSVYMVWSGEGIHVRIHEKAIPPEVFFERNFIDVAYAIVEYVIEQNKEKLKDVVSSSNGVVKIENLVDVKRVFTVPLSLHRKHDLVAVVLSPRDLEFFDLSWTKIGSFKSSDAWRMYSVGEAENNVIEVLKILDKIKTRSKISTETFSVPQCKLNVVSVSKIDGEIPRFQLMALLQAARYYLLTGDIEKAKSFGLNRAIFYAYLKYYGRGVRGSRDRVSKSREDRNRLENIEALIVEDGVEVSPNGLFMIGGKEQTPEDYDKNVVRKVETILPYEIVWNAALKYVSKFPKHILIDPQKFYEYVYEAVRDSFVKKVVIPMLKQQERSPEELSKSGVPNLLRWAKKDYVTKES